MSNPPVNSFPKLQQPILFFSMALDDSPSLNHGRLSLWDYELGYIHRWIATSGTGTYQRVGSWSKQRGGVCPPNSKTNPKVKWYQVIPKLYHGTIVKEGFLIKPNEIKTPDGVTRSEIMLHEDGGNNGSYGCWVIQEGVEWQHCRDTLIHCCGHLQYVRGGVEYTW